MKKQNVRTISLIVCTFTYLLVGAAVFDALESETERKRWEALQAIENMIIEKYDISEEDFKVMETVVLKTEPHKAGQQWKFTGAFYYATTVLTTIGYGHSTPSTVGGKLFTMFYAIVGIPLGLVMFQSIGERVNRLSSFVIRTVKKSLHCRQTAASELDLICVVTTLSSLTIAGGAAAFSKFENWSYFDSVYYCFITLTTIGFGDMVALQKDNALNTKPEYVMFSLIFILFGLAIVAASLNLLVLRFVTMNTEDERRDEAQAMQALQVAVRLEGDVITANGSILSGHLGHRIDHNISNPNFFQHQVQASLDGDNTSICSCHCACFSATRKRRHRYHMRRSPPVAVRTFAPPPMSMQKQRLKAISLSTASLPPLYSLKDFHASSMAIKTAEPALYADDYEDLDDLYNLYHQTNHLLSSANAADLDLYNDFNNNDGTVAAESLRDVTAYYEDFEVDEERQQMTTTTTIASLRQIQTIASTLPQHTSDLSPLYQPQHRASL